MFVFVTYYYKYLINLAGSSPVTECGPSPVLTRTLSGPCTCSQSHSHTVYLVSRVTCHVSCVTPPAARPGRPPPPGPGRAGRRPDCSTAAPCRQPHPAAAAPGARPARGRLPGSCSTAPATSPPPRCPARPPGPPRCRVMERGLGRGHVARVT